MTYYHFPLFLTACLLLCALGNAHAEEAGGAGNVLTATRGAMKFDYTEKDTDGSFLDGEYGYIPGIGIDLQSPLAPGQAVGFAVELYSGTVNYDGAIQVPGDPNLDGLPIQSDTQETVSVLTGYFNTLISSGSPDLRLYGKFSYKRWQRDINGRTISGIGNQGIPFQNLVVSGLSEEYNWWNLVLGLRSRINVFSASHITLNAGILRTLEATMKADFGPVTAKYNLQERWGYEAGVAWQTSFSKNARIGLAATYTYWEFGRSNVVFGFLEPDSESKMAALFLLLQADL